MELGTGILFALLYWHYGLSLELAIVLFYFALFIVLAVIDLEHKLILNVIVYPSAIVALIIDAVLYRAGVVSYIIGFALGFAFLLLTALVSRGGMGIGDVKMAGLIGLIVGFPQVIVSLLIGILLGGLVAIILLVLRLKKRKEAIPFGPFLALGAMLTLVWGRDIVEWYFAFFSF